MEDTDAIPPVSGTTPTVPVVSAKSGNVYEKALIEKYIGTLQSSDTVWHIHRAHYSLPGSYRPKWHGSHHWRRIDQGGADRGESQYVRLLVPNACPLNHSIAEPQTLPPRAPTQTSIPSLLTNLQSEFDAIMLESLEVKRSYQDARQELANALYREDAATRALARIMKERDEART